MKAFLAGWWVLANRRPWHHAAQSKPVWRPTAHAQLLETATFNVSRRRRHGGSEIGPCLDDEPPVIGREVLAPGVVAHTVPNPCCFGVQQTVGQFLDGRILGVKAGLPLVLVGSLFDCHDRLLGLQR